MTDAHLGAVRTAIAAAEERHDPEYLQCLRDIEKLVQSHITVVEIPKGRYSMDEFRRIAAEKLNRANREE